MLSALNQNTLHQLIKLVGSCDTGDWRAVPGRKANVANKGNKVLYRPLNHTAKFRVGKRSCPKLPGKYWVAVPNRSVALEEEPDTLKDIKFFNGYDD